jgi:hypothetical protein
MQISLDRIDRRTANAFFDSYEHLGNCGLGVWHWGAFLEARLIAAVSFGTTCFSRKRGLLSSVAAEFELSIYQICRGGTASTAPFNTASRVVSAALQELRRLRGDCLVIGYADRAYNEIGTIYQACNGLYTGQTEPKDQANYIIRGKLMSGWIVRKRFGTRSMEALRRIDKHVVKIPLTRKYRYVFVQASRQTRRIVLDALQPLVLPYPNRRIENIPAMNVAEQVKSRIGSKLNEGTS